jgi:hypothetical protein
MFFIKEKATDLYYRDFILDLWEDQVSKAHFFTDIEDAQSVKKALIKDGHESVTIKKVYSKEEAQQYVLDYVAAGAEFIRETKDGYVFKIVEAFYHEDGTKIKIFKYKERLDHYTTLKK